MFKLSADLGTTAYVIISGMMLGFQEFLKDQLINNDAHIKISARQEVITASSLQNAFYDSETPIRWVIPPSGRRDNQRIENVQGWIDRLNGDHRVLSYSPQLTAQVIFRRAQASLTGRVIGVDPTKQSQITNISAYMLEGKFQDIGQSGNRIVVGEDLLKELGGRVSETLLLSVGKGSQIPFKVVGTFRLGIKQIDETTAYASLRDVQRLNMTPSVVSGIGVKLFDVNEAQKMSEEYASTTLEKVQSWSEANANILSVFKTQDIVRNSMTISILVVAGFGIYNILSILVNQKRRDIAILRSIGFESRDILNLFFSQGIILGLIGGLLGLLLGWGACLYIETIPVVEGRIGSNGHMMMSFDWGIYFRGLLLALGSSSVAAWIPSRAAGKLTPIQIIRTENS